MAFVRKKGRYAYLVESYRDESGKPRQRVLAYLGELEQHEEALAKLKIEHPEFFEKPEETRPVTKDKSVTFEQWDRRRD